MDDKHRRSIAKAVSWRIIGTFITAFLIFAFTRKWGLSLGIGILDFTIKVFTYYLHERAWLVVRWGKS